MNLIHLQLPKELPDGTPYCIDATLYTPDNHHKKPCIIYIHGGGLLFGSKDDLPSSHVSAFLNKGYPILALNYPLAPQVKLPEILADIQSSIEYYLTHRNSLLGAESPYLLWGRSAGAYLALLAASKLEHKESPIGIISYYGYGLLCDEWYKSKGFLQFPTIPDAIFDKLPTTLETSRDLLQAMPLYIGARQRGIWFSLVFEGREKHLLLDYSLRLVNKMPCPLFCAHATNDPDVPFSEFQSLNERYNVTSYIVSGGIHDFDRDESSSDTQSLLLETLQFIDNL